MKPPRPMFAPGIRMVSPKIAAFCGVAAVATVLVAVVVGPRLRPVVEPAALTSLEVATGDVSYDLFIVSAGSATIVHEERDGSDATPYSLDEIGLRLRQAKDRRAPIKRALLVVNDGMSMRELQARIAELKQLGIASIAVAAEIPDAEP